MRGMPVAMRSSSVVMRGLKLDGGRVGRGRGGKVEASDWMRALAAASSSAVGSVSMSGGGTLEMGQGRREEGVLQGSDSW